MRLGRYRFSGTFTQNAKLPAYKGSAFRGVFGHALKQTVCALRKQDCKTCLLQQTCLYARVFEYKANSAQNIRQAALPHPYVIQPPLDNSQDFASGSPFAFELLLFGAYNESLPYFIYAVEKMGRLGIGKGKARFRINQVYNNGAVIYEQNSTSLNLSHNSAPLAVNLTDLPPTADIRLRLVTPLRVKQQGNLAYKLDFPLLIRTALRRISSLWECFGDGEPDLPYADLIRDAGQITTISDQTHWHDWPRYSNRQHEVMQFGGLTGDISFAQVPGIYQQLLQLTSLVHLGKQTSFGLGQITMEPL